MEIRITRSMSSSVRSDEMSRSAHPMRSKRRPQTGCRANEMRRSLGSRAPCNRLTDWFAEGDAHAAVVEGTHEPKSY